MSKCPINFFITPKSKQLFRLGGYDFKLINSWNGNDGTRLPSIIIWMYLGVTNNTAATSLTLVFSGNRLSIFFNCLMYFGSVFIVPYNRHSSNEIASIILDIGYYWIILSESEQSSFFRLTFYFGYASIGVMKTNPKRVCAWCSKVLSDGAEPATHGICDDCYDRVMAEIDKIKTTADPTANAGGIARGTTRPFPADQ